MRRVVRRKKLDSPRRSSAQAQCEALTRVSHLRERGYSRKPLDESVNSSVGRLNAATFGYAEADGVPVCQGLICGAIMGNALGQLVRGGVHPVCALVKLGEPFLNLLA